MRGVVVLSAGLLTAAALLPAPGRVPAADPPERPAWAPKFRVQEIDTGLSIGYAVLVADLNGDKKPDIVVVDQLKVVWYENPTWKKHVILDGKTKPDNVCAAVLDVDGDGKPDIVLGAGWRPSDTQNPGTLQWLKQPDDINAEWTLYPIPCDEPTVHRVRVGDLDGDGKPEIILAPLQGRECTAKGNWTDGRPVRIMAYRVPKDPTKPANWKPEVLSEELHVVHNIDLVHEGYADTGPVHGILTASYEGVTALWVQDGKVIKHHPIGPGNQDNPKSNRGSSEVRLGRFDKKDVNRPLGFDATIEPWHGNQVVVYLTRPVGEQIPRIVIDDRLRWGHAVQCADIDGEPGDEIVVGVRDDPAKGDPFTDRRGVRIYKTTDGTGEKWERYVLEDGGVAVEDLAVADLDGDGRKDIITVGRQTKNARIYWNLGK